MASKRMTTLQNQQLDMEAKQLEMQKQAEKVEGEKAELETQTNLSRILATQNAVFGSSGFSATSGSFTNIQTEDTKKATEAIKFNKLFSDTREIGINQNISSLRHQAFINRRASKYTRQSNVIGALSSLGSTFAQYSAANKASKTNKPTSKK
jgi:hypothetical protein